MDETESIIVRLQGEIHRATYIDHDALFADLVHVSSLRDALAEIERLTELVEESFVAGRERGIMDMTTKLDEAHFIIADVAADADLPDAVFDKLNVWLAVNT